MSDTESEQDANAAVRGAVAHDEGGGSVAAKPPCMGKRKRQAGRPKKRETAVGTELSGTEAGESGGSKPRKPRAKRRRTAGHDGPGAVGTSEKKEIREKKQASGRKKAAPAPSIEQPNLPGAYGRLYQLYDALDTVCCFLIRSNLACTIDNVSSMIQQLHGGKLSLSMLELTQLCMVSPDALTLHYVPFTKVVEGHDETDFRLEITFPTAARLGKGHCKRRREMVVRGLKAAAVMAHEEFLLMQTDREVKVTPAALPEKPEKLAEAASTDPYVAPPAPLVRPGTTGLYRSKSSSSSSSSSSSPPASGSTAPQQDEASLSATSADVRSSVHTASHANTPDEIPFTEDFVNNVPAEQVPHQEADCITLEQALPYLQSLPFYRTQVEHTRMFPASAGEYGNLHHHIEPCLLKAMHAKGVSKLFRHQADGINAALSGQHLAISTATSSGKSIIYNIPVLQAILTGPARALYLFPTKALAQDQLRSLKELLSLHNDLSWRVSVEAYDGDTPFVDRSDIRDSAHIILSNPDMLHQSVLPQHKMWSSFLRSLRYVVIDEAHMYTGVFGAHVSGVIRRLVRLCLHHDSPSKGPQVICCSATIANPAEHFTNLVPLSGLGGVDRLTVIDKDYSPRGNKLFVIWNPPIKEWQRGSSLWASPQTKDEPVKGSHDASTKMPAPPRGGSRRVLLAHARKHCRPTVQQKQQPQQTPQPSLEEIANSDGAHIAEAESCSADGGWSTAVETQAYLEGHSAETEMMLTQDHESSEGAGAGRSGGGGSGVGVEQEGCGGCGLETEAKANVDETRDNGGTNEAPSANHCVEVGLCGPRKRDEDAVCMSVGGDASGAGGGGGGDVDKSDTSIPTANLVSLSSSVSLESPNGGLAVTPPRRRSTIVETAMIFTALIKQRIRTLSFCKVRKLVEMVLRYSLQDLHATAPDLANLVKGYRGGYTKADRRAIEQELFGGRLLGVTATCALELGVDVGTLDATLHMGFPGSISSLWQQAGRAGRGAKDSMAILVCFETAVDQYFVQHPDELLCSPPERAVMDPLNPFALRSQLLCAADEAPICGKYMPGSMDKDLFGGEDSFKEAVQYLVEAGMLSGPLPDGSYRKLEWVTKPARNVNLRMIDPITFEVRDESREYRVIDHVGYTRAFFELFEGAIYMHQARQYLVTKLDLVNHKANVRPVRVGYYTSSRNHTDVNMMKKLESSHDGCFSSGCAQVVSKVWGYRKIWLQTGKIFEMGLFSLPPLEYETRAFFIDLGIEIQKAVEAAGLCYVAGIHAVNHALLAVTPLFLMCDARDVDTEHVYPYQQRPRPPRIVVYDKRPGGIGAAERLFDCIDDALLKTRALMSGCPCNSQVGCPACIADLRCSDYNVVLDKNAALIIVNMLIDQWERSRREAEEQDALAAGRAPSSPSSVKLGPEVKIKITPRKEARQKALRVARAMDDARARDLRLQKSWVDSFPNYRPEQEG